MKKIIIALVVSLVMLTALGASAATISLTTPDGTFDVGTFDWTVGNALSDNGVASVVGGTANFYYQASLGRLLDGTGALISTPGLGSTYEITAMVASNEQIVAFSGGLFPAITLLTIPGGSNYAQIFLDTTPDANALGGTGYGDGIQIMAGSVLPFGLGDPGTGVTTYSVTSPVQPAFDQFGANNYPAVLTTVGQGQTTLESPITSVNPTYVHIGGSPVTLDLRLFSNTSNNDPFLQIDPSGNFTDLATATNITPTFFNLGNGFFLNGNPVPGVNCNGAGLPACPAAGTLDFQFQADANSAVRVETPIPEPSTLLLLGAGLLGIGAFGVRRKKSS